jgi:hypothetical protein
VGQARSRNESKVNSENHKSRSRSRSKGSKAKRVQSAKYQDEKSDKSSDKKSYSQYLTLDYLERRDTSLNNLNQDQEDSPSGDEIDPNNDAESDYVRKSLEKIRIIKSAKKL